MGSSTHGKHAVGVLLLGAVALAGACGGGSAPELQDPIPTVVRSVPPGASDLVPTIEELVELGIEGAQADCFVREIDPDGDGRVGSADDFGRAFAACFTGG